MNRILRSVVAVLATTAVCGVAASNASALSLGPAGTAFSMVGDYKPSLTSGQRTFDFGDLLVVCSKESLSGRLNGTASVTAATTIGDCSVSSASVPSTPATVSAPRGLTMTLLSYGKDAQGYNGGGLQLGTGPGGLTVQFGACTMTIPPNTVFRKSPDSLAPNTAGLGETTSHQLTLTLFHPARWNTYTGSSGCPAKQRGTHSALTYDGAGLSFLYLRTITGLAPTP